MPEVAEAPISMADALKGMPNPPPDDTPKGGPLADTSTVDAAALKTGVIEEPEIKPLVNDEPETPGTAPEKKPDDDDMPQSLESAMRDSPSTSRKEQERIAAEKKVADEAAAAATAKAEAETASKTDQPAAERDADLKHDMAAHTHPKTRQVITKFQTAAKAARDERDRISAEKLALQKERDELQTKLKSAPLPKEIEDEVKTLRERVRELDITKDPIIEQKYDRKIAANHDTIIRTLKSQGFGMVKGEGDKFIEDPKAVAELIKGGLTFKNLNPYLKKLDEADLADEAEAIRDAIRQNNRLASEKTQEIESWKADHGARQQAREQQGRQHVEQTEKAFTEQTDRQYRAELERWGKDFPSLKEPPAPLATDTPAVKAAKEAAIVEFRTAADKISAEVASMKTAGVPPEKMPEVAGRISANAILAIAFKNQVLPAVKKQLAALTKERDDALAELNKIRDAGKLSRLQGQAPGGDPNAGKAEPASLEDALRAAMPGQG